MEYNKPEIVEVALNVKGAETENGADGPSKCSSSCCFYRDGGTW